MALTRIAVVVVLVIAGVVVLYGMILDRSGQNRAFIVPGLIVLGLMLTFISAWFLSRALADARWGRSAGSILGAVAGGLSAMAAAGCLAGAALYALIPV